MFETVCIRCGKTRILARKWEEKSDRGAAMIYEQTVCPDNECQKVVDDKFEAMREKKRLIALNKGK